LFRFVTKGDDAREVRYCFLVAASSAMTSSFMTIAEYWESHGYSKAEAKAMEKEQIKAAIAEEQLHESMDGENLCDYF